MLIKNFFKGLITIIVAISFSTPTFADDWLYTVRPNEAASTIANKYLLNPYRIDEVLDYNKIEAANQLLPGTVLKIPLNMLKFGPARVKVTSVQGDVKLVTANSEEELSTLHTIRLGDKVVTGEESSVMMRFADNSELLLGSGSELIFDVLSQWGRTGMVDSRMRLVKGNVEGRVKKLIGPKSKFEVHTPSAVATVRGTEFRVRVGEQNSKIAFNEVSEGKVQVENNVAQEIVPMGFGLVTEEGKKSDGVIELLPAPTLIESKQEYFGHSASLSWKENKDASAYRWELFEGKEAVKQLSSRLVEVSKTSFDKLDVGNYTVRIRAVDSKGLEGLDREHTFFVNGKLLAPVKPFSNSNFKVGEDLVFNWQQSSDFESYRVEVSNDIDFKQLVSYDSVTTPGLSSNNTLSTGEYYWRVSGKGKAQVSPFTKPIPFTVTLPEIVLLNLSDVRAGEKFSAEWNSFGKAQKFHWQIAEDSSFSTIVSEGEVKTNRLTVPVANKGYYYFRATYLDESGKKQYSTPQMFMVY